MRKEKKAREGAPPGCVCLGFYGGDLDFRFPTLFIHVRLYTGPAPHPLDISHQKVYLPARSPRLLLCGRISHTPATTQLSHLRAANGLWTKGQVQRGGQAAAVGVAPHLWQQRVELGDGSGELRLREERREG